MSLYSTLKTKDVYPYQSGAFVAFILVFCLSFYMYSICKHYLEILIHEEKTEQVSVFDYANKVNSVKIKMANKIAQDQSMTKARRDQQLEIVVNSGASVDNVIKMFKQKDHLSYMN